MNRDRRQQLRNDVRADAEANLREVGRGVRRRRLGVLDYTSQEVFAKKAGVSTRTVAAVEQGTPVSPNSYTLLSRALGYTDSGIEDMIRGGDPTLREDEAAATEARAFSTHDTYDGIREDLDMVMRHLSELQTEILNIAERAKRAQ